MLFWTLQITVISIVFIFLVHHLFLFFKSTLTVPKIKDLVNAPAKKYEEIYNTMSSSSHSLLSKGSILPSSISIPTVEVTSMKDELKSFLKSKSQSGTTSISTLDSFSSQNFSEL
uniref:Uncharacterized protein n=1 Tax=viral metagenome TaxID=1070528 RepID=A0A6C0AZX8_9ZZZZ